MPTEHDKRPAKPVSAARSAAYVVVAVTAGFAFPLQSRANGSLSDQIGSPIVAAVISFLGGLILLLAATLTVPSLRAALRRLVAAIRQRRCPPWYLLAGVFGAYLVFAQSTAVPVIGVALLTVAIIAGQTTSGLIVDRIGFGSGTPQRLTAGRILGVILTVVAVIWSVSDSLATEFTWMIVLAFALPLLAGIGSSFQQAMNGALTRESGNPFAATVMNFATGTLTLVVVAAIELSVGATAVSGGHVQWWMLTGGPLGIVYIAASAFLVPRIGVLLVTVAMVTGQLCGSLGLDLVFPTGTDGVSLSTLGSLTITLVAVAVTSGLFRRRYRGAR